jgi:hypothetical protein
MDLKKLPPSLLVVLGLACSRNPPTVGPCLSPPYDPATEGEGPPDSGDPPTGPEEPGEEPGDDPSDDPSADSPLGPCLSMPAPEPSPGPTAATSTIVAPQVATRDDAIARVVERGALPPDVVARLRGRSP